MNISIFADKNIVIISDKLFYRDDPTIPNLGALVCVVHSQSGVELGRDTTKKNGVYSIVIPLDKMRSGQYEIRIYGSKTIPFFKPKGDWESFYFQNPLDLNTDPIVFSQTPILQITEGNTLLDFNENERTEILIDLMFLGTVTGEISYIECYYKNTQDSDDKYVLLESFAIDSKLSNFNRTTVSGIQLTEIKLKSFIYLNQKPSSYDFYCMFFNPLMKVALDNYKQPLKIYDKNVIFNGMPDLAEYIEAFNLKVINAGDEPEEWESGVLPNTFAHLVWQDIKEYPWNLLSDPPEFLLTRNGYTGSGVQLTYNIAQNIYAYGIWMYVVDITEPPQNPPSPPSTVPYPGYDITNWYFVGDFVQANAQIRCPANKYVAFWVGMKTKKTEIIREGTSNKLTKKVLRY